MSDAVPVAEPPLAGDEVATLLGFLDLYRGEVRRKADGLTREQLAQAASAPSPMALGALLKHLTYVEVWWFSEVFAGEDASEPWASVDWDADADWDWHSAVDDEPAQLFAAYDQACARSRAICATALASSQGLDTLSVGTSRREPGQHFNLRWIVVHLIEELARHAGHADLIREAIDGQTG